MANAIQNVGFGSPGMDYSADLSEIERRRALAQALQEQSMQPIQAGGVPGTAIHPFQGLAKMAQAWAGKKQAEKSQEQQRQLAGKSQMDYQAMLSQGLRQLQGTPAGLTPEDASGNVSQQQAVAPDPMAALGTFSQHPMGQQLAPLAMQQYQRQQLINSLRGGAAPQQQQAPNPMVPGLPGSSVMAGSGSTTPTPQAQPQGAGAPTGGPAGGVPMEAWLMADPTGKSYMEQLAKDHEKAGAPVVNRGYGIGTMQNGRYVADPASVEQALQMERGKAGIGAQYGAPHAIPLSGGQNATIFPAEQPGIISTGRLPARFGNIGRPQPSAPIPAAPGAQPTPGPRVPAQQGLGTVGLTQSQPDIIQQARATAGGKALDEQFGKDYAMFVQGGAADAAKQLAQLQDVMVALKRPHENLTGPIIGKTPDAIKSFVAPQSIAMRERVEEVVQRSLRAILGAQFTEKEGERLIARAYNPNLSEQENSTRVGRLFTQLNQAFNNKKNAADYFAQHGTLDGWRGKLPSIADFDPSGGSESTTKTVNWADL